MLLYFFKQLHACSHPPILKYETKVISTVSLPLQFQSQPTGFGKRCCQPVTAVQPAATGVGMPVTSQCPPHRPHLFPMMPTRTSCSRPRLTMSVRTSQRARTSCLRTPYLESERYGGMYKETLVRKGKETCRYMYNRLHNTLTLGVQIKHHLRRFHVALLLKIGSNVHSTGGFRLCHLAHLWLCGCYSSPGCKN